MTLHDRIRAVVEERLAVAREASRADEHTTPTGEHWRWECGNCDTVLAITPVTILNEYLECPACEGGSVALRSAEEYPTASVGPLPHFVVNYASEQRSVDALHIAANDPADAILSAEHALSVLERHAIVHRNINWLELDDGELCEESGEIPVCGRCVPKHSGFRSRAEVPEGPCIEVRELATRWRVEVDG